MHTVLVELTRGALVESVHAGSVAVADADGRLKAKAGDSEHVAYLRSSAKPFQALPLVESGAADRFGLDERELAIACASHIGTDAHVEVVHGMQKKTGVAETDLLCGVHNPPDGVTMRAMVLRGETASPARHNCSGKHTGMLACSRFRWDATISPDGLPYIDPANPIQQSILETFASLCGISPAQVMVGTDGCSAPNFAVSLHQAATAMARFMDPQMLSVRRADACRRLAAAMTKHPELVRGEGRFDTELMRAGKGRLVSKGGAEGYQLAGLAPGALGADSPALGIAVKIADGDGADRAASMAMLAALDQIGWHPSQEFVAIKKFYPRVLTNWSGLAVGEIRTRFQLV
jgi:L-asparaginase II